MYEDLIVPAGGSLPATTSPSANPAPVGGNVESFVQTYLPLAQKVSEKTGVAPESLLGQWGLETGWGKSVIPGTNNLGNIKDVTRKGPVAVDNMTKSSDSYMAFETPDQFGDHFVGLLGRRYKTALGAGDDSQKFFTELKRSGYAEDPGYIQKGVTAANMVSKVLGGEGRQMTTIRDQQAAAPAPGGEYFTPQRGVYADLIVPPEPRSFGQAAADTALGAASGVVQGVGLLANVAGADNPVSRGASELSKDIMDMQSPQRQAERAARADTIRAAEASGSAWEEIKANVGGFLEAPVETTLNALGTSAPTILTAFIPGLGQAGAARLILQGALGAAQGAGAVKGSIYEAVERKLVEGGMSKDDAAKIAAGAQAYDSENGGNIVAGAILGAAAGTTGIEAMLSKAMGSNAAARGLLKRAGMGVLTEAPVEGVQGGQERYASNVALQNEGFDVPTFQGVAGQAAGAAIASAPGGAAFGALTPPGPAPAPIPPALKPVADKAAEPNSPLSKAAMAGNTAATAEALANPPAAPVDPVQRLAELEAIGRGTPAQQVVNDNGNPLTIPGEPGRIFTAEEKAEYDQLKALRDATPGMTPADEEKRQQEQAKQTDEIFDRVQQIRQLLVPGTLDAFRADGSPTTSQKFLSDLATAASKSASPAVREQALNRAEIAAQAVGLNLEPRQDMPRSGMMGPQTRTAQVGEMISTSGLSSQDRSAAIEALSVYRNRNLPQATRDAALGRALELVGRNTAPTGTRSEQAQPAVLGAIPPQPGTPEYFESEAERRENGAYQFRELGFDEEANALLAEADSLRESAASARAGELGVEDTPDADVVAPVVQQTVEEATQGLPRPQIPAADPAAPAADNTAVRRKRKGQYRQLADAGFRTIIRDGGRTILRNDKTNQEVLIEGMADAQLARVAIADSISADAARSPNSPQNNLPQSSDAQNQAGNYPKPRSEINGFNFRIENDKGSKRSGVAPDGKRWESTMQAIYGHLEIFQPDGTRVKAKDGDDIDLFVGDRADSPRMFVIDQINPDGSFDEPKVVAGVVDEDHARRTYLANYEPGWTGLGAITEVTPDQLRQWARSGGALKPFAESGAGVFTVSTGGRTLALKAVPTNSLPENVSSPARGARGPQITQRQAGLIKALGVFFGKDVIFFSDPERKINSDGFVKLDDNNTIYIDAASGISPLAVFGHELMHLLRRDNPVAYAAIAKVVSTKVANPQGFRANYQGKKGAEAEKLGKEELSDRELEELISDLNGNLMGSADFWQSVFAEIQKNAGNEARSVIAQLSALLQRMLNGAINAFKGRSGFRADEFIKDADEVRAAFREGLAQYAKAQGISRAALQADFMRADRKLDGEGDIRRSPARAPDDGLTVTGYHFSKQPRTQLSTGFYGTGLQGSDRAEIMEHPDRRLRERLSFYANKGTGVRPESGVGGIAHKATLTNIYDSDADMKRLKEGRDRRGFESAVINAGYSGYLARLDGSQPAQVILLGRQTVNPEVLGPRTQIDDAPMVPAKQQRPMNLGDKILANKALPAGKMPPQTWAKILMATMPEETAKLLDVGALGTKDVYKDELVRMIREADGEIRRSPARARDEFAEVEAKYKDTKDWLKAPNGSATNLNKRQWVQVRTPSFKAWFGDWEEAFKKGGVWSVEPGSVSTAVGDDGEPLVVYHGTDKGGFMEFATPGGTGRGDLGIFTTPNKYMASSYVRRGRARDIEAPDVPTNQAELEDAGYRFDSYMGRLSIKQAEDQELFSYTDPDGNEVDNFTSMDDAVADAIDSFDAGEGERQSGVYALFVNIRNPSEEDFEGAMWTGERLEQYQVRDEDGENIESDGRIYFDLDTAESLAEENEGATVEPADDRFETTDDVVREARRMGMDGAIIRQVVDDGGGVGYDMEPSDVFVAFDPAQLKSADFNGGEFSVDSDDIRRSPARDGLQRENELEMSTRSPSAVAKKGFTPEDSKAKLLISDFASGEEQERWINTVAELVTQYPNYREAPTADAPKKKLERLVRQMTDNLVFLHNQVPAEIRDRSKLWYDGANAIANRMKSEYGISEAQAAGILAVLSPQKDWFMNVSLAKRVAGVMAQLDTVEWDARMTATAARIFGKAKYKQDVDAIRGKPLRAINSDYLRGMWIRTYDEANNSRDFQIVSPEGDDVGAAISKTGKPAKVAWGGIGTIAKAATIFRDGTFDTIDEQLGRKHKVRNFYNNILVPKSRNGHVTIDTHAVAAALLRPLSGNSIEVMHNFSGPKANAVGLEGTYALYEEAYRRAADRLGLLPRELQSITWEAVRGMYRPGFKSQSKNVDAVDKIWTAYKKGRLSYEKARDQSVELAGGIDEPSWFGPDLGAYVEDQSSFEPGDLADDGVPGQGDSGSESGRAGGRARAAAGGRQAEAEAAGRAQARAVQDAGGIRRSPGRLPLEGGSPEGSGREEDGSLNGLPRDFNVAGIDIRASHWAPAAQVAQAYMESRGLEYRPPSKFVKVDKERAARIAAEYDRMKHDPKNPVVLAAFRALADETVAQYRAVMETGLEVEFINFDKQGDPYAASPRLATEDVRNNNHFWVFSTRDGYGTAEFDVADNPMLAETEFIISGQKALVNDLFRVVHDYFGHVKEGLGFRADGEENAWRAHSAMFTPLAQRALTTETRGQNSWVNYGPKGEFNRKASAGETHYADQKTGLLPLWASEDGRGDEIQRSPARSNGGDDITIMVGDVEQPKKVVAKPKDAVTIDEARGRKVSYDVEIEDTGETAKMTVDAGEALADYDDRIDTMKKLLECLKK